MAFQNSHFSLAYDRPSITMVSQPEIPYDQKSMPGYRSYFETLCRVTQLALEVLRGRMTPPHPRGKYHEIREYRQRMQRILAEAVPHLRHREHCSTLADHIERSELQLHSSYVMSVLCRSSLDSSSYHSRQDSERRATVRSECIASLISTVEAFVELHSLNAHSSRSWISLQRSIASAFLLVANEDGQLHPKTWDLVEKLEVVLADHVNGTSGGGGGSTATANHLASSLHALQEVSAAFRAGKMNMPGPDPPSRHVSSSSGMTGTGVKSSMLLPSPQPTDDSSNSPAGFRGFREGYIMGGGSASASANANNATRMSVSMASSTSASEWDMRNILDRVSEAMLFPNVGIGNEL